MIRTMSHDPYRFRHRAQRLTADADQAEFLAFTNGPTPLEAGIYDDRVAGAMDDFATQNGSADTPHWQADDLSYDSAVGSIHEEIERRILIMGRAYPFALKGGTLIYNPNGDLVYEFLLSICNSHSITEGEYAELPRVFERLSAQVVAAFFGENTQFIHTGWPRDPSVGISFKEAMRTVSEQTGEWDWEPEGGLPEDPVNGDSGCDFVVWPRFPDRRKIGQLFILGQCACGNNWTEKWNDLNLKKLQKWFNPLSTVDPVRTFTTPYHLTDAVLKEASREAGVLFDRARLTLIAHKKVCQVVSSEIKTKMRTLIKLVKN